jgi:hypothetical protein
MPFGLCNAPATFQRYINSIFAKFGWRFCLVYLDDIIVFSSNLEDHIANVIEVISELLKFGLQINYDKSVLFGERIEYLGYVIESKGISL